ncbi:hypothetical protein AAK938_01225 [Aerococcaceae bacterium 50-4]
MFYTIQRLYVIGRLNDFGLDNAVKRGWITPDQQAKIKADKERYDNGEIVPLVGYIY